MKPKEKSPPTLLAGYDSLGDYGKMRINFLYESYKKIYDELLGDNLLISHCQYIDKQAIILRKKIIKEYTAKEFSLISALTIADEIIKSNLVFPKSH